MKLHFICPMVVRPFTGGAIPFAFLFMAQLPIDPFPFTYAGVQTQPKSNPHKVFLLFGLMYPFHLPGKVM